jgi:hypothetical protein
LGKRSRGDEKYIPQAHGLLEFLAPLFCERDMDAVKGIGWALKTLGKFYPQLTTDWLCETVARETNYRALMLTKATTYLNAMQRAQISKTRRVSTARTQSQTRSRKNPSGLRQ